MKYEIRNTYRLRKFFVALFYTLTFPFRKPIILIPLLMLAYLAPTFLGARPTGVHLWYWNKIKNYSKNVGSAVSNKTKEMLPDDINISVPDISVSKLKNAIGFNNNSDMATAEDNPASKRKAFQKSDKKPEAVDVLRRERLMQSAEPQVREETYQVSSQVVVSSKPVSEVKKDKLPLIYAQTVEYVNGVAEVINANEISINGTKYFLHGVYVDPLSEKGMAAQTFLQDMVSDKVLNCQIKAYSYQGVGTLICTVNGQNINRLLVDRGYSKNVDLD